MISKTLSLGAVLALAAAAPAGAVIGGTPDGVRHPASARATGGRLAG